MTMFSRLLACLALAAVAAMALAACNDEPTSGAIPLPGPPRNPIAAGGGVLAAGSMRLSWSPPADSEGITAYHIRWRRTSETRVDSATTSLESEIPVNGNVRTFDFPTAPGGHDAAGFYVRTDTPGNHHFARVMVRNNGGKILQSIPPNRYIELETSYQISANVPFAKASRGNPPRGIEPTPRDNPITQYLEIP